MEQYKPFRDRSLNKGVNPFVYWTLRAILVSVFVADLSSQSQVRRLAEDVLDRLPRVDVLVNNANGHWEGRQLTPDGIERTFALNHLGPFLLTNLLLDRLKQSARARVVTVAVGGWADGRIDLDDLNGGVDFSGARAFSARSSASTWA